MVLNKTNQQVISDWKTKTPRNTLFGVIKVTPREQIKNSRGYVPKKTTSFANRDNISGGTITKY